MNKQLFSQISSFLDTKSFIKNKHGDPDDEENNKLYEFLGAPFPYYKISEGKLLIISDLHIPYMWREGVDAIIDRHASPDTTLIINGDLVDMETFSSFTKNKSTTFEEELSETVDWLKDVAPRFKEVLLIKGNHEERLRRSLMRLPEFVQVSAFFHPEVFEILKAILAEYNIRNIKNFNSFFLQINDDMVLAHPQNFRRVPGATAKGTIEYVLQFVKTVKYVVVGHTHRQAKISHLGVHGIEQGCLCGRLPYEMTSGRITLIAQDRGYVIAEIKDGETIDIGLMTLR